MARSAPKSPSPDDPAVNARFALFKQIIIHFHLGGPDGGTVMRRPRRMRKSDRWTYSPADLWQDEGTGRWFFGEPVPVREGERGRHWVKVPGIRNRVALARVKFALRYHHLPETVAHLGDETDDSFGNITTLALRQAEAETARRQDVARMTSGQFYVGALWLGGTRYYRPRGFDASAVTKRTEEQRRKDRDAAKRRGDIDPHDYASIREAAEARDEWAKRHPDGRRRLKRGAK